MVIEVIFRCWSGVVWSALLLSVNRGSIVFDSQLIRTSLILILYVYIVIINISGELFTN